MMSIAAIRQVSRDAAVEASRRNQVPFMLAEEDVSLLRSKDKYKVIGEIPFLGTHLADGWERVDLGAHESKGRKGVYLGDNEGYGALLVDSTGLGERGEPALTVSEFAQFMADYSEYGYAIVEQGPFQVKIGLFKRADSLF